MVRDRREKDFEVTVFVMYKTILESPTNLRQVKINKKEEQEVEPNLHNCMVLQVTKKIQ